MQLTGKELTPEEAVKLCIEEYERANKKFPPFNSAHEGYGVMKEEFDEFWDEIKQKNPSLAVLQSECIQMMAMCMKFLTSPIYGKRD